MAKLNGKDFFNSAMSMIIIRRMTLSKVSVFTLLKNLKFDSLPTSLFFMYFLERKKKKEEIKKKNTSVAKKFVLAFLNNLEVSVLILYAVLFLLPQFFFI